MTVFTFDTTIPAAANNPSVDQPNMQLNNASISGILAVDHVGFNTNSGGEHLQSTYVRLGSKPAVTGTDVAVYSKLVAALGTSQLFFEDSAGTEYQMTGTLSTSGASGPPPTYSGQYILQGGLIIQWGNSTAADGATIVFPNAFPTACFGVILTPNKSSISNTSTVATASYPTTTGFVIRQTGDTSANRFWIALGN
jgi:hypothetical protein